MGNFHKMEVWKDSRDLAIKVYKTTSRGKFANDISFRDQLRRSAISIPSNLAEGENAGSEKSSIRYFNIASGSLAELRTQLEIAKEIGYIRESDYQYFQEITLILAKRIIRLIQFRKRKVG